MGTGANNDVDKSLNERGERAAGRQDDRDPQREAIKDAAGDESGSGRTAGASGFGRDERANRREGTGASPSGKSADVSQADEEA